MDADADEADVMVVEAEEAFDPMPDEFVWRGPGVGPATGQPLHDLDALPLQDVPSSEVGLLSLCLF